jgi:hypothetical protein
MEKQILYLQATVFRFAAWGLRSLGCLGCVSFEECMVEVRDLLFRALPLTWEAVMAYQCLLAPQFTRQRFSAG